MTLTPEDTFARYWEALTRGDRAGALAAARAARAAGASLETVLTELVCAAQTEVGRRWAANEWTIAQEHVATGICEDVLAVLAADIDAPARGSALVTCAEGEWHSLPARVLAETLRAGGWRVQYLGASVPTPHLAQQLHDLGPDLTAVSCSLSFSLPRLRQMIEASRQAGVPVIVGGRGCGPDGRWGRLLGANAWAPSAAAALQVLNDPTWPAYTDPAPPLAIPDDAYIWLHKLRADLVRDSYDRLRALFPPMADYTQHQLDRTVEDLGFILDFLAAALFVDDVTVFTEFAAWLGELLVARGVPARAAALGMQAIDEVLPDLRRARDFLAEGMAVLAGNDETGGRNRRSGACWAPATGLEPVTEMSFAVLTVAGESPARRH